MTDSYSSGHESGLGPRKRAEPPTFEFVERAALVYLERYDASEGHLRRVLAQRVERALAAGTAEAADGLRADCARWIDAVVARARERGLVDDRRFARALARRLARRGTSYRAAWLKLRRKGVDEALAREVLGDAPRRDDELLAAAALARRRGLGPYRTPGRTREGRRERELAVLARAGFGPDVAARVVDAAGPDELPQPGPRGAFD